MITKLKYELSIDKLDLDEERLEEFELYLKDTIFEYIYNYQTHKSVVKLGIIEMNFKLGN